MTWQSDSEPRGTALSAEAPTGAGEARSAAASGAGPADGGGQAGAPPDALWYRPRFTFGARTSVSVEGGDTARALGWDGIIPRLSMALRPVVGTHSGRTLGAEAVIGNARALGFESANDLLDCACDTADPDDPLRCDDRLADVEAAAHGHAVALFASLPDRGGLKLFLNIDPRLMGRADPIVTALDRHLQRHEVPAANVVLAVSERTPFFDTESLCDDSPSAATAQADLTRLFEILRRLSTRLALDDFGAGYASLPLLTLARPDLIKLDRFLIQGATADRGGRLMLNTLTNLAHLLGSQVIADGVQTVQEYHVCRQAGCDYIQGPLVGTPIATPAALHRDHEAIRALNDADLRTLGNDSALITAETQALTPIGLDAPMSLVFERFRFEKDRSFFPVVDSSGEPVGIVRDLDLKEYTYSLYGKDLLSNRALGRRLDAFLVRAPIADLNTKAEKILELFSASTDAECVLITRDRQYIGFLSAASLLKVINEKNLALARDQNPLSRLPGNTMINEYIAAALLDDTTTHVMTYLDFDNFKPFNDTYGYRQGDRAITLFADLMRKMLTGTDVFLGHVGGDDFFVGVRGQEVQAVIAQVRALVAQFRSDVESFYDEEARRRGYIMARTRDGTERRLDLLSASAAIVRVPPGHRARSADEIAGLIATLKKQAKAAPDGLAVACCTEPPCPIPDSPSGCETACTGR